jgi:MATE family multidrug resistance protein
MVSRGGESCSTESPLETGGCKDKNTDKIRCWRWLGHFICGGDSFLVKHEIKALFHLSWPIILTVFLQLSLTVVNVLFCGRLGKAELDASGLAISFTNVTGLSVGMGFATACDTLFSQAYGGKNLVRVGITLQKAIFILGLLLLPIYGIWLNTESIMLLLQQDPEVARLSGQFVKVLMAGLPGNFFYTLLAKYLQNQGIVRPLIFVGSITLLCSVLAHYLVIFVFHFGLLGAAGVLAFTQVLQPLVCLMIIRYKHLASETWHGWSWQSLNHWGMFLQLALLGIVMTCVEWWSFTVVFFVSGAISDTDLAANVVLFQVLSALYMIPFGISVALSIRVGTYLGANEPACARRAALVTMKLIVVCALFVFLILLSLHSYIGYIYTSDSEAIRLVSKTMPIVALMTVFDYIQAIIQGIFRGSGRQMTGAGVNAIGLYLIGLPIAIPLAITAHLGVLGLWVGVLAGMTSLAVLDVVILWRFNWQNEAKKARVRAGVAHLSTNSTDITSIHSEAISLEVLHQQEEADVTGREHSKLLVEDAKESECSSLPVTTQVENTDEMENLVTSEQAISLPEKRRLLFKRSIVLLGAILIFVTSGIASHYQPYQPDEYLLSDANMTDAVGNSSKQVLPTSTIVTISISSTHLSRYSTAPSMTISKIEELWAKSTKPSPSQVIQTRKSSS